VLRLCNTTVISYSLADLAKEFESFLGLRAHPSGQNSDQNILPFRLPDALSRPLHRADQSGFLLDIKEESPGDPSKTRTRAHF